MTHPSAVAREAQAARELIAKLKDIIGDDEDFAMDVIEGQTSLVEVVNSLIAQELEDKAHITGITAHAETLAARKARLKARIERRRNALAVAFQTAGIKGPIRCALGTVGLNATVPKAVITDGKLIPKKFWKQPEPELDLKALTAALKANEQIGGASLSNGGVTISIRTT